jgi:hypothetical protein
MLETEIESAQRSVRTDAYQMSIGELVTMYENNELIVDPEFQRLFRWNISQKSKFIESILLGIPLPSIFVFEKEDGNWELIDGLQRISTILEFLGRLEVGKNDKKPPSILDGTKYLPSLHNVVWERSDKIETVKPSEQRPLERTQQLAIRRSRIGVQILKRPSDDLTKYDLFQRLNAGGTQANAQELRNCIMLMVNPTYFRAIKEVSENKFFNLVLDISQDQKGRQKHIEFAVRFIVLSNVEYDGKLDVEEYIDQAIVKLASSGDYARACQQLVETFKLLHDVEGKNALRKINGTKHSGKVTLGGLEGIAVGVGKNLEKIVKLGDEQAKKFIHEKIREFWSNSKVDEFSSPGLRGTDRIRRTVPFGERLFRP